MQAGPVKLQVALNGLLRSNDKLLAKLTDAHNFSLCLPSNLRIRLALTFYNYAVCYLILVANCTKYSTNNAGIEYKCLAMLYGYLDRWLSCTLKQPV